MFRTRFKRDVVTEFLAPTRPGKRQRAIVLCDGMPSIPRKQPLAEFLSGKGYWVFYPRYRGAWESGGEFLARSPHLDILDVIGGLAREFRELAFGRQFRLELDGIGGVGTLGDEAFVKLGGPLAIELLHVAPLLVEGEPCIGGGFGEFG